MEILDNKAIWRGFVRFSKLRVKVPRFGGGMMEMEREVHDHGNAACILPIDPVRRKALLVRQWRIPPLINKGIDHGVDGPLLEIVAGIIDPGETPEQTARREALEETGHSVANLRQITACFSSPGTVTEYFVLFAGEYGVDDRLNDGGGTDHDEEIEVLELGFDQLRDMLRRDEIRDAKTFMAITWLLATYD